MGTGQIDIGGVVWTYTGDESPDDAKKNFFAAIAASDEIKQAIATAVKKATPEEDRSWKWKRYGYAIDSAELVALETKEVGVSNLTAGLSVDLKAAELLGGFIFHRFSITNGGEHAVKGKYTAAEVTSAGFLAKLAGIHVNAPTP